ncbi:type VII secretion protein EccB [Streptacidiphilus sp. PB12-B1b]|uniref:type VII secretion protein EccB n=1 Tax=Streptacidiphilus sp. PB12-B1b TaxID=2705012 RepID=UPI0015FC3517|nr:type VII secretion protein EccB [Streptacidiphilus sp. PB12-B1b]QMU77935.1 type VII secretion protein EccB [Streptacidiphilus sp. PB12-B1b]
MQSQRDQLQAYRFVVGRLVSGLVHGEPDAPSTPMRRSATGVFAGVMLTMLAVAGAAVFGLVSPSAGASKLTASNTILVEQGTGIRYLYEGGELDPLLNYSSALLALGSATPALTTVSRAAVDGVPHGPAIGIPGAPDSLPSATAPTTGPWSVCSAEVAASAGPAEPVVTVEIGSDRAVAALPDSRALLVGAPDGSVYLAWHDQRFLLPAAARAALGYDSTQPLPVGDAWLDALPSGPVLSARTVPGLGRPGPAVDGRRTAVGQVFTVTDPTATASDFVMLADGLSPLTPVDEALLVGSPATQAAYGREPVAPIRISTAALAAAPHSAASSMTLAYPPTVPRAVGATGAGGAVPCFTATPGPAAGPAMAVGLESAPDALQAQLPAGGTAAAHLLGTADHVRVPASGGLLAQAGPGGAEYLVTDTGAKYPLAAGTTAKMLGYGATAPVQLPSTLLKLLPTGPVLDPDAPGLAAAQPPSN